MKKVLFFGRSNCSSSLKIYKKLKEYNFQVIFIKSTARSKIMPKSALEWKGDYILSYRNLYFLPAKLLSKAKNAAINFHPGPPEYPGSGCTNFALMNDEKTFGVTAHIMNEHIDSGEIIQVKRFNISSQDNISSLTMKTHKYLEKIALKIIDEIYTNEEIFLGKLVKNNQHTQWKGKRRKIKEIDELQKIELNISKAELEKLIRATHIEGFPVFIELYGYRFELSLNSTNKC